MRRRNDLRRLLPRQHMGAEGSAPPMASLAQRNCIRRELNRDSPGPETVRPRPSVRTAAAGPERGALGIAPPSLRPRRPATGPPCRDGLPSPLGRGSPDRSRRLRKTCEQVSTPIRPLACRQTMCLRRTQSSLRQAVGAGAKSVNGRFVVRVCHVRRFEVLPQCQGPTAAHPASD